MKSSLDLFWIFNGVFSAFAYTFFDHIDWRLFWLNYELAIFLVLVLFTLGRKQISIISSYFILFVALFLITFTNLIFLHFLIFFLLIYNIVLKRSSTNRLSLGNYFLFFIGFLIISSYAETDSEMMNISNQLRLSTPVHADFNFHVSIAESYRLSLFSSAGFMGKDVWMKYHTVSHFLFFRISELFRADIPRIFSYSNALLIAPLFLFSITLYIPKKVKRFGVFILLLMFYNKFNLLNVFAIWFPDFQIPPKNYNFKQYFLVLSQNLSLAVLPIFILQFSRIKKWNFLNYVVIFFSIFLITGSKISNGFMTMIYSGSLLLKWIITRYVSFKKILLFYLISSFGFILAYHLFSSAGGQLIWKWNYAFDTNNYGYNYPLFLINLYPVFFILSILFFVNIKRNQHFILNYLSLVLGALISFLFLNLDGMGSAGMLFSMSIDFLCIPLLMRILSQIKLISANQNTNRFQFYFQYFKKGIYAILISLLLVNEIKHQIAMNRQTVGYFERFSNSKPNPHIKLLDMIKGDSKVLNIDKESLVYIPKKEKEFWNLGCLLSPFSIPAYSGLPAIYGLPLRESCKEFYYGLANYSLEQFSASSKIDYSDSDLCLWAVSRKFRYIYKIENMNVFRMSCRENANIDRVMVEN